MKKIDIKDISEKVFFNFFLIILAIYFEKTLTSEIGNISKITNSKILLAIFPIGIFAIFLILNAVVLIAVYVFSKKSSMFEANLIMLFISWLLLLCLPIVLSQVLVLIRVVLLNQADIGPLIKIVGYLGISSIFSLFVCCCLKKQSLTT